MNLWGAAIETVRRMVVALKLAGGLNKDAPAFELAPGMLSDAANFRSDAGVPAKWGGTNSSSTTLASLSDIEWLMIFATGTARHMLASNRVAVYTGAASLGPYGTPISVIANLRIGANTAEIQTSAPHGLTIGDVVPTFGFTEASFNMPLGATITATPAADKFQYATSNTISANATVMGGYVVWTSANTTIAGTAAAGEKVTGGSLNGIAIVNFPWDATYFWAGDTAIKLRRFPFLTYKAEVARVFKAYVVQLVPTMDGTEYPFRVIWSNSAQPGSIPTTFVGASTNDSRYVDLAETNGKLVDCLPLGDVNIVYKKDCYYSMQLRGGVAVMGFQRIDNAGLLAPDCVCDVPGIGHVFLTPELDVRAHQGGPSRSVIEGRFRQYIKDNIYSGSTQLETKSFVCHNPVKGEVWVGFPTTAAGTITTVLCWNYKTDEWYPLTPPASSDYKLRFAVSGLWQVSKGSGDLVRNTMLVGCSGPALVGPAYADTSEESGQWFGTSITGTLERSGLDLGDPTSYKVPDGIGPQIDAAAASTSTWYTGTAKTADGTPDWTAGGTHTQGTTIWVDQRATAGRFCAWKMSTTAFPFRVRSLSLRYSKGGKRGAP